MLVDLWYVIFFSLARTEGTKNMRFKNVEPKVHNVGRRFLWCRSFELCAFVNASKIVGPFCIASIIHNVFFTFFTADNINYMLWEDKFTKRTHPKWRSRRRTIKGDIEQGLMTSAVNLSVACSHSST